jgi:hypothetical protein
MRGVTWVVIEAVTSGDWAIGGQAAGRRRGRAVPGHHVAESPNSGCDPDHADLADRRSVIVGLAAVVRLEPLDQLRLLAGHGESAVLQHFAELVP